MVRRTELFCSTCVQLISFEVNLHPQIALFTSFGVPSFFLVTSLCACLALLWSKRRAHLRNLDEGQTLDITFLIMVGVFTGARLFHIFFEEPLYYRNFPYKAFFFWDGGFVFYGGLFGGLLAGVVSARRLNPRQWIQHFDHFAPIASLMVILGRLGCFLNGCCYGAVCDLPWAMVLPDDQGRWLPRHPTQLYMSFGELFLLILLLKIEKRHLTRTPSSSNTAVQSAHAKLWPFLFPIWLLGHSTIRFIVEFFRADDRGPAWLFSQGGWWSLILLIGSIGWLRHRHKRLWGQ